MNTKFVILILMAGLLSAWGSQPAQPPASQSTDKPVPATQAPASVDTKVLPTNEPATSTGISFANDILPILQGGCLNCHGGDRVEKGLSVKSYAELMAGSDNGPVIVPSDVKGSLLVELVTNKKMPKKGPKLTPPQIQLITDWVSQGALDN